MIQSPKTRFLANSNDAKAHLDLVVSPAFLRTCDFTMLQLIKETHTAKDHAEAAANWFRLEGARSYLNHLLTIAELEVPMSKTSSNNLNHRA